MDSGINSCGTVGDVRVFKKELVGGVKGRQWKYALADCFRNERLVERISIAVQSRILRVKLLVTAQLVCKARGWIETTVGKYGWVAA